MAKKKKHLSQKKKITEVMLSADNGNIPDIKNTKNKYLTGLLILIAALFIFLSVRFFSTGVSGYHMTLLFYAILFLSVFLFIRNKVVKYNFLAIVILFFCTETYLRISGKRILNYMELKSNSLFTPYLSNNFEKNRLINGLYTGKPNNKHQLQTNEYSYENNHNELGLREKPLNIFKHTKNILILGDSYTEGVGAPSDSTIAASLEYFLHSQQKDYRVVNGGVSGSDLFYSYKLLEHLQPEIHPAIVILNLNYSDINDIAVRGGDERFKKDGKLRYRLGKNWEYFYSFSYLFRFIAHNLFKVDPYDLTEEDIRYAYTTIEQKVDDYIYWCNSHQSRFVLVFSPGPSELFNNYFSYAPVKSDIEQKKYFNIIYLDGFIREELYNNKIPLDSFYYRIDLHMRPKGNWFWGKAVAKVLADNNLL